ncbi:hypothetical protein FEM48_Zijuj05G0090500 [Ziziphus jujuba var. spinosa]|uniref:Reverse transcriptase RNase H-like domain-containing protein n=1 Tax=Ziziphus jujuba var. spinosa TaxID=714518 RepID=A0A978VE24_ZIZJJ|nr:hypothetical protein FEM48_Zijuj05G0090500 [Ziziphus jujuba var. spinosa]
MGENSTPGSYRFQGKTAHSAPQRTATSLSNFIPKTMKLDFPKYDGKEDPTTWVCRADRFFALHEIAESDMIGSNQFEDQFGELIKLRQTGTVLDYQSAFEILSKIGPLSPEERPYLLGRKFIVRTDHQSLKHLYSQKITTMAQQKWLYKLLGFDFQVEYKKGGENIIVDALSRRYENLFRRLWRQFRNVFQNLRTRVFLKGEGVVTRQFRNVFQNFPLRTKVFLKGEGVVTSTVLKSSNAKNESWVD